MSDFFSYKKDEKKDNDEIKYCPNCGAPIVKDKFVCHNCGEYLDGSGNNYVPISDAKAKKIRIVIGAVLVAVFIVLYFIIK